MEHTSEGSGKRGAIVALAVCLFVLLFHQSGKIWLADRYTRSNSLTKLERGTMLEPGNADAWDALGRFRQLDFTNPDPSGALLDYQRAVQANPLSAHHWMNLAEAYEANGDIAQAGDAFQHAQSVYPLSAEVSWNYGNFLLRQDLKAEGYNEIQHSIRTDPTLLTLAISRTWRSSHDVNVLLNQVLPVDQSAYLQALNYFASAHENEPALIVWARIMALGKPIALDATFPFLDALIAQDRSTDARTVWFDALGRAGFSPSANLKHSLIWNGDFAQDFLGGGLGWRWLSPAGTNLAFDSVPAAFGVRSVQITFGGGSNLALDEPAQYVSVDPSRVYRFHAYMRTEAISTEMGIRFSITDPNHIGAVSVRTLNLTGSHPWTAADAEVLTSPQTHFLVVRLEREPSRMFDNKLSGVVWVADVTLTSADMDTAPGEDLRTQ